MLRNPAHHFGKFCNQRLISLLGTAQKKSQFTVFLANIQPLGRLAAEFLPLFMAVETIQQSAAGPRRDDAILDGGNGDTRCLTPNRTAEGNDEARRD